MVLPESDTASSSQTEADAAAVSPPGPGDDPPPPPEEVTEGLRDLTLSEEKPKSESESGEGLVLEGIDADGEGKEELEMEPDQESDEKKGKEGRAVRPRFPVRPGQPDCSFYVRYSSCRFGMKCKFNHPHPAKKKKNGRVKPGKSSDTDQIGDKGKDTSSEYVEQSETQDTNEETEKVIIEKIIGTIQTEASKGKERESTSQATVQECKYFSTPGGCKFGKACRYIHPEGKPDVPSVQLNFLGLPIRPSEKECPYYMRTGSCKYSTNCRYHHPDPKAVASQGDNRDNNNNKKNNNNYGTSNEKVIPSSTQQPQPVPVPVPPVPSWSEQATALKEPMQYVAAAPPPPSYVPPPPHGMFPNQDWNGYQVPVNPYFVPVQNYQPPSATHANMHHHHQAPISEYPERPGQPECQHYVKNGFCKYKLACKYHHPKIHHAPPSNSPGAFTSVGLPLKPDQPVCTYYSHYGVCKFGPACRYHHPLNHAPPAAMTGPQSS